MDQFERELRSQMNVSTGGSVEKREQVLKAEKS
jgi:hypothetical protein